MFSKYKGGIAAVVIEPILLEEPQNNFLNELLLLTQREGALLVFDEVVTGFRFAPGGAQEYFGVMPDMAAFGKGMANGMPIAAVVGRADIMNKVSSNIYISSTFAGETLSLAACIATIREVKEKNVNSHIWALGKSLQQRTNELAQTIGIMPYIECIGLPPRLNLVYRDESRADSVELKTLFLQEVVKRGVFLGWNIFMSYSHTQKDIDYTLEVFREAMLVCREAISNRDIADRLEGELARSIDVS